MEYNVLKSINWILVFIEMLSCLTFVSALLGKREKIRRILLFSLCYSIIYSILNYFVPHYLSWVLCIGVGIVVLSFLYKEKITNMIVNWLLTGLTVSIIDCVVSYTILSIFELNSFEEMMQNSSYYIGGKLIIAITVCIIAALMWYSKADKITLKYAKDLGVVLNIIVTFMLLFPNLVMIMYYHDKKTLPYGIVTINICAIIILFFVSTYNAQKSIKLAKAEQDLVAQQKYSKTQQDLIDGLRTFKHDYSNTLQTMYGYVQYNKIDKLKEMFTQVLDETKAITTLDKLNPNTIKDPGLFGILNGKYQKAKENKIKMEVEIFGDIEGIDIDIFDLTRMLGILLDNAIEAAKDSKKKKITFMLTERKDEINFEITNTISEKHIDINKIREKGVSSKGENRGLGLYKVEEIVNKYDSVQNITQIESGIFIQSLTILKSEILATK